jgi:hypothetical protein
MWVALADRLGRREAARVVAKLGDYYEDQMGHEGLRVASQLVRQMAEPAPYDLSGVDLAHYRELEERWRDWTNVARAAQRLAADVLDLVAGEA